MEQNFNLSYLCIYTTNSSTNVTIGMYSKINKRLQGITPLVLINCDLNQAICKERNVSDGDIEIRHANNNKSTVMHKMTVFEDKEIMKFIIRNRVPIVKNVSVDYINKYVKED